MSRIARPLEMAAGCPSTHPAMVFAANQRAGASSASSTGAGVAGIAVAGPAINPGPFQFHGDSMHVRQWMAANGYWFCRKSEVREIMRPIPVPAPDGTLAWGLCDGIHRDDHEFIQP